MRDRPADLGLAPYGERDAVPAPPQAAGLRALLAVAARRRCATPRARRVFWVLFATFFVCGASTNGLIQTHLDLACAAISAWRRSAPPACSP